MALADARARLPHVRAVACNPSANVALLHSFADLAKVYTPSVSLDLPDGLALDITGCAHLFQGEHKLAARLHSSLCAAGASIVRLAVAPTPDMARALARYSEHSPCFVEDDEQVRRLPVLALECGPDDTQGLKRAGLKTINDIAVRPSLLFTARFSAAFSQKLARVLGEEDRRITSLHVLPLYRAERNCADPVASVDVITLILTELAVNLSAELRARGEGGRCFITTFMRSDGAVRRIGIETSQPTRDPAVIMRLYRDRLDTLADPLDPGFGFDLIRFEATRTEPFDERQTSLDANDDRNQKLTQLIDRLSTILGSDRVIRLQPVDSHSPERAQVAIPAGSEGAAHGWTRITQESKPCIRPPLLFARPHPIDVESDDDCPSTLCWRRVTHSIAFAAGPERIGDEWWRTPSGYGTRDYYRVESTEGRRFWIFRASVTEQPEVHKWFLHGLFP